MNIVSYVLASREATLKSGLSVPSIIIFPDENRVCHAQVSVYFRLGTVSIFRDRQVDDLQSRKKLSIPPPRKHDIIFLEVWSARPSAPTFNTIGSAMSIVAKGNNHNFSHNCGNSFHFVRYRENYHFACAEKRKTAASVLSSCPNKSNILSRKRLDFITLILHWVRTRIIYAIYKDLHF